MSVSLLDMAECPLTDPNLDIVSELEHKVGSCLCALCECGLHICPGRSQRTRKASFRTSYRVDYPSVKPCKQPLKPFSSSPYRPSNYKFEGLTSHQQAYQPYSLPKRVPSEPRSVSPQLVHSVSSTSYQRDFPNWGPSGVPKKHNPSAHVRTVEAKFQGVTTYEQHYGGSERRKAGPRLRVRPKRESQVHLSEPFCAQTTSQRSFLDPSKCSLNPSFSCGPDSAHISLETPPCHHTTTARLHYSHHPISKSTLLRTKLLRRLIP